MKKTVSATEARVHLGEVLRTVAEEGATYIIERAGKPQAVVVSSEEYERLVGLKPKPSYVALMEQLRKDLGPLAEVRQKFDWEEFIRQGREERGQQLEDAVRGR